MQSVGILAIKKRFIKKYGERRWCILVSMVNKTYLPKSTIARAADISYYAVRWFIKNQRQYDNLKK